MFVAGGRAGGVRTLLQPARVQCLRLSERFFHLFFSFDVAIQTRVREEEEETKRVCGSQLLDPPLDKHTEATKT